MKIQWCWRCKTDIPMLDDAEWSQVWAAQQSARPDGRRAALAEYERLTGLRETNFNALFHHRIAAHGPPCPRCGKVLRTPVAYKCFECGHVLHAPGWSFLFTVTRSANVEGRGTFVEADRPNLGRQLTIGDAIELRSGTSRIARTTVLAIEDAPAPPPVRQALVLWLPSNLPELQPGHTAWLSPPHRR